MADAKNQAETDQQPQSIPIICPIHNKLAYHYCIAPKCQCKFLQVCNDCTQQGPHPFHKIISIEEFQQKYRAEHVNAEKKIKELLDLQDINMEIRRAFQKMREEVNEKLDQAELSFAKDIEILSINMHNNSDLSLLEHYLSLIDPQFPLNTQKKKVYQIAQNLILCKDQYITPYIASLQEKRKEVLNLVQQKLKLLQTRTKSFSSQLYTPFINSVQSPECSNSIFVGLNFPEKPINNKLQANAIVKNLAKINDFLVAACFSNNNEIQVWDLHLGICLHNLIGHKESVNNVVIISDISILSCSADNTIKLWNWKKETILKSYEGHLGKVWDIVLINKKQFASCSSDGKIIIWNLKDQRQEVVLAQHNTKPIYCLMKMRNQFVMFSGGGDMTVRAWDLKNEKELFCFQGHKDRIMHLSQINDDYIASGSVDFTIKIWEVKEKWCLEKTLSGHQNVIWKVVVMDQDYLISASEDKSLGLWKWKEEKLIKQIQTQEMKEVRALIKWNNQEIMFSGTDCWIRTLG